MVDSTHYSSYFSAPSHETHETVDKQYFEMKQSFLLHWVCSPVQHSKANTENVANCSQDVRVNSVQWVNSRMLLKQFWCQSKENMWLYPALPWLVQNYWEAVPSLRATMAQHPPLHYLWDNSLQLSISISCTGVLHHDFIFLHGWWVEWKIHSVTLLNILTILRFLRVGFFPFLHIYFYKARQCTLF